MNKKFSFFWYDGKIKFLKNILYYIFYKSLKILCNITKMSVVFVSRFLSQMANLKKKIVIREFAVPSSMACPSILIQGPRRGCSERRLFGVSIATATKLPLQRPPESCVSTFYPLSRPIECYHDCNHSERKRHGSHTKIHCFTCLKYCKDLIKNNCYWHENIKSYLYKTLISIFIY